jgi:hypothetical protein
MNPDLPYDLYIRHIQNLQQKIKSIKESARLLPPLVQKRVLINSGFYAFLRQYQECIKKWNTIDGYKCRICNEIFQIDELTSQVIVCVHSSI